MSLSCPNCFTPVRPDRADWTCVAASCPDAADPPVHSSLPRPLGSRYQRGQAAPAPLDCEACGSECAEKCADCDHVMPQGWRSGESVCIAMAGARATGKSIYIGVLIKQLEQLGEQEGFTVKAMTDSTSTVFKSVYEGPLYEQRGLPGSTAPVGSSNAYQREPLVFILRYPSDRKRFLVVRDVAGEDLEAPDLDTERLSFFGRADGVFFLLDPLQVREIRDQLQDLVSAQFTGGDPLLVLEKTLQLIKGGSPRLAVVLSKFDAVQTLGEVRGSDLHAVMSNAGAACVRDDGLVDGYDHEDGELLHEEIHSLLHRLRARQLTGRFSSAAVEHGIRYRYFAISALGDAPSGLVVHPRGIAPFRCLDPLNWVLYGSAA